MYTRRHTKKKNEIKYEQKFLAKILQLRDLKEAF